MSEETLIQRLLKALTHFGQSAYDLAEEVGSDYMTVTRALVNLEGQHKVIGLIHDGECNWQLR